MAACLPLHCRRAEAVRRLLSQARRRTRRKADDPGLEPAGSYDDPERRPLGERCLLGFGSTSGPPALPDYFYNNLHQIVQTPDSVMILTEMVHDARIVRMNAQHLPKTIRQWMGDSVGHWEGDTLVVDTTNFTDKTRFRGSTENLHVVERFSRVDARTLLYRFTVEDPATWAQPWTGEYAWPATNQPIYEYACHEANYALGDILRGARTTRGGRARPKATEVSDHDENSVVPDSSCALRGLFAPAAAHHAFGGEFDANRPVLLKGKIVKVEWVNPHAWIHVEVTKADGSKEVWMVEGGSPNSLLRHGVNKRQLAGGNRNRGRRLPGAGPFAAASQRAQRDVPGRPQTVPGLVGAGCSAGQCDAHG